MAHENGDKQRLAKIRHVQGMLDETDSLSVSAVLKFADKPLTALCYLTIVLKSLKVETKDFLILALSSEISLV